MKSLFRIVVVFLLTFHCALAKEKTPGIPEKPSEDRLVNDLAGILSGQEEAHLEKRLLDYFVESSTQVAIITVESLNGYEKNDFTTRLAEEWGIGKSEHDNGILLLVKPKYPHEKGEVYIATGYGLEGAATDLATGQIIRHILIPHFKQDDYFGGIDKASIALIDLTKGEYNEKQYLQNEGEGGGFAFFIFIALLIIFFILVSKERKYRAKHYDMNRTGGNVPLWTILSTLNSAKGRHSGSFGDFSSGGGSFSDFGGFGGGSFGGGGAGGSW